MECNVPTRVPERSEVWRWLPPIQTFFEKHRRIRPDYHWYSIVDPFVVLAHVGTHAVRSFVVNETYLLVYDVSEPWYTRKRIVEEMLVVKVYDGPGKFDDVLTVLESIRTAHGAVGIAAGNSLARYPRALERMYTRRGYQPSGTTFYRSP